MADGPETPIARWTVKDLRQKLQAATAGISRETLEKVRPVLQKVVVVCRTDLEIAQKRLAAFQVTGDHDAATLGAIAEFFSRPLRLAVNAAHQKLLVAEQALKHVDASTSAPAP